MELAMGANRKPALEAQDTGSAHRSPSYVSEIQVSIGRWLGAVYEVPQSLPERLVTLVEQLAEPSGGDN